MKREALRHPKMLDLAARLRIPREHAIGTMDVLLDWVHDMAPRGDIGKWPNGAIAVACGWSGDPDEFVNALVASRWLDIHPMHRLLVHDYPDHAERFVKAKLARDHQWFCYAYFTNGRTWNAPENIHPPEDEILPSPTTEPTVERTTGPPIEPTVPCDQTNPNQTKPNHPQTPAENRLAGGWKFDFEKEKEASDLLTSLGYNRVAKLITECRTKQIDPQSVIDACGEYQKNRFLFNGPGAIAERLRTGVWPANGVNGNGGKAKKTADIESLRCKVIKKLNEARNWSDELIMQEAIKRGWA